MNIIVIGYIPMFYHFTKMIDDQSLQQLLDCIEIPSIECCIWLSQNDQLSIALGIDGARTTKDHMLYWCDNEPEQWFEIIVATQDDKYILLLSGNPQKTKKRFTSSHEDIPSDCKLIVLTHPLTYIGQRNGNWDFIHGNTINVYFVESKIIKQNLSSINKIEQHMLPIGRLNMFFNNHPQHQDIINQLQVSLASPESNMWPTGFRDQ